MTAHGILTRCSGIGKQGLSALFLCSNKLGRESPDSQLGIPVKVITDSGLELDTDSGQTSGMVRPASTTASWGQNGKPHRCPQLQPACCDEPMAVVSHHRKIQRRLVALEVREPQGVRARSLEHPVDPVRPARERRDGHRRIHPQSPDHAAKAKLADQLHDRAAGLSRLLRDEAVATPCEPRTASSSPPTPE